MKKVKELPKELAHLEPWKHNCNLLKKDVYAFYIPQWNPGENETRQEWLDFRKNFVSSSDVGTVLGLNPFGVASKLFYNKLGKSYAHNSSKFSVLGHVLEPHIADLWQYYDGNVDNWVHNYESKNVIRKNRAINAIIVNKNYPWLSASIDYLANSNQACPITGEIHKDPHPVEIKSMTYSAAQKYKDAFPPHYAAQLMLQMIVLGVDYGESATLIDRDLIVKQWNLTDEWKDRILTETRNFWDLVEHGKELQKLKDEHLGDNEAVEVITERLQALEPAPEMSTWYQDWLKEEYKTSSDHVHEIEDLPEQAKFIKWTLQYNEQATIEKEAKALKQEAANNIKKMHRDKTTIDAGVYGKTTWRRSEGKRDYFKVNGKATYEDLVRITETIDQMEQLS